MLNEDWKEFEKDLHWIAETGRGHSAKEMYDKWKAFFEEAISEEGASVYESLMEY